MSSLITQETVEALGFLDWEQIEPMVGKAFATQDKRLMGVVFVIAQWVVFSKRFGMTKASPSDCLSWSSLKRKVCT